MNISKISAEEKKERSGWGRVELGQLGTSWSSNSSGDENCLWCEDVCLRCAIFFRRLSRKWEMKVTNMKSRKQEDIRGAVPVKVSEKATGKELKYSRSIFVSSRFLALWIRRRGPKTWAIKVGLDACCMGVNPTRFKMIRDYLLGWYRQEKSVDGEKRSTR